MRICFLVRSVPEHCLGGMEINTLRLAQLLAESGHQIVILTTSHPDGRTISNHNKNPKIYYISGCQPEENSVCWGRKYVSKLKELHCQEPFDLIHSHGSAAYHLMCDQQTYLQLHLPVVVTYHSTHFDWIISSIQADLSSYSLRGFIAFFKDTLKHIYQIFFMDRLMVRKLKAIIALDSVAVEKIRWQYSAHHQDIYIVPTCTDTHLFSPGQANPDLVEKYRLTNKQVLLFVARLETNKGPYIAINVLSKLLEQYSNAHLLIVGDGTERHRLMAFVENKGLKPHVTFTGSIDHHTINEYFNLASVMINPILHPGGYPTTVIEAMACGLPVVTSCHGGVVDVIEHGVNGYLVDPKNIEHLNEIVLSLYNNNELRRSIGLAARSCIISKFSYDVLLEKTIQVYKSILS